MVPSKYVPGRAAIGRALLIFAIAAGAALLFACAGAAPAPALPTQPAATHEPAVSTPPSAAPTPAASAAPAFLAPGDLLGPADLALGGAYPEQGWHRCDDFTVDRNLERFRGAYKVASSIAAVWEYGSKCGSADRLARLDEYAWLVRDLGSAGRLVAGVKAGMYLANLSVDLRSTLREFGDNDVLVRAAALPGDGGRTQYVAEAVGRSGIGVTYMRLITDKALSDDQYLQLGRAYLARVGSSPAPPAGQSGG